MPGFELRYLIPLLPEVFLASAAMLMLMVGVYRRKDNLRPIAWLAIAGLAVALVLVSLLAAGRSTTFEGLFVVDYFAMFMKVLVLMGSALSILMSLGYAEREAMDRFEFPILMLFATVGMMMMISANDLIALYLGLELQSLSLYVLAAFRRDTTRSTEAGLKYFVLGALSSGMLLYGASIIYGFAGTTSFDALAAHFAENAQDGASVGFVIGLVFMLAGLAFKISAVPFHMWTPDVYEGAPTPVTAFFSVAPKIAAVALLLRVVVGPFGELVAQWQQIVVTISIASMLLGAFAAIYQTNIKRLMAYSSIGHIGYALVGLAAGSEVGVRGVLIYMAIYLFMNIGTFTCILCMRQNGRMVEEISDLSGLSKTHPMMALALAIFMFSMAGIPPTAGFLGKFYVFMAAIDAGLVTLAVIGVLSSVVGSFYYLRIIKIAYFDEPREPLDRPIGREMGLILAGTALVVLLFFVYPLPILNGASAAAASLFAG
jgi:NADH-quinone oxidoreductase subunit N